MSQTGLCAVGKCAGLLCWWVHFQWAVICPSSLPAESLTPQSCMHAEYIPVPTIGQAVGLAAYLLVTDMQMYNAEFYACSPMTQWLSNKTSVTTSRQLVEQSRCKWTLAQLILYLSITFLYCVLFWYFCHEHRLPKSICNETATTSLLTKFLHPESQRLSVCYYR